MKRVYVIHKRLIVGKIALLLLLLPIATAQAKVRTRDKKVWYLFSHGLADTYKQAYKYAKTYKIGKNTYHNERYLIDRPFVTFNYPDACEGLLRVNRKETSLAQDNEIECLKSKFEKTVQHAKEKETNNSEIVIFGLSRGASAALNLMALYNPPLVKALVLESPFDTVGSIIDNKRKQLHLEWLSHDAGEYIMETIFRRYNRNGIQPIDVVSDIRKDLPILIVCSKEDPLVPCHSSIKLYQKLKESGHSSAHLFIADHGKHSKILEAQDGDTYQAVVHAFYEKYGLPHNAEFALQGKAEFALTQNTV